MNSWDTDAITTGEWWVVLIGMIALLAGTAIGYALKKNQDHRERAALR